jgi:hypothetical protein
MTMTRHRLGVRHNVMPSQPAGLHDRLETWADAGLIDRTELTRIEQFEARRSAAPSGPPGPRHGPIVVEAMAYLGGALALAAAALLVELVWTDLSTAQRLAVPAGATVAMLLAGHLLPATVALRRLRSALWLVASGTWAATLAVLGDQVWRLDGLDTFLLVGSGSALFTAGLYLRGREALQNLALLASLATTGAALGARAEWDGPTLVGLGIWSVAVCWAVAGELGALAPRPAARFGSAVALVAGALAMGGSLGGQFAAAATLAWLFTVGIRAGSVAMLGVAAIGTLQLVPRSVTYFFPNDTRVAVPVILLTVGAVLVGTAVAVSRRRPPPTDVPDPRQPAQPASPANRDTT